MTRERLPLPWFDAGSRLYRKRRMTGRSPAYCRTFVLETCRAELCHWLVFALVPPFFLWNPWYVAWPMVPCAIAVNLPRLAAPAGHGRP